MSLLKDNILGSWSAASQSCTTQSLELSFIFYFIWDMGHKICVDYDGNHYKILLNIKTINNDCHGNDNEVMDIQYDR